MGTPVWGGAEMKLITLLQRIVSHGALRCDGLVHLLVFVYTRTSKGFVYVLPAKNQYKEDCCIHARPSSLAIPSFVANNMSPAPAPTPHTRVFVVVLSRSCLPVCVSCRPAAPG